MSVDVYEIAARMMNVDHRNLPKPISDRIRRVSRLLEIHSNGERTLRSTQVVALIVDDYLESKSKDQK